MQVGTAVLLPLHNVQEIEEPLQVLQTKLQAKLFLQKKIINKYLNKNRINFFIKF